MPRDRLCEERPILCRVGRNTITQSIRGQRCRDVSPGCLGPGGAAGRLRQNCFLRREDVRGKVKWLQGLQGGPMCRRDCETFRIPPLMSKRTIRTRDEGGWSGVGGT